MLLNDRALIRSERSTLGEDRGGDGDLADGVEERGVPQVA